MLVPSVIPMVPSVWVSVSVIVNGVGRVGSCDGNRAGQGSRQGDVAAVEGRADWFVEGDAVGHGGLAGFGGIEWRDCGDRALCINGQFARRPVGSRAVDGVSGGGEYVVHAVGEGRGDGYGPCCAGYVSRIANMIVLIHATS